MEVSLVNDVKSSRARAGVEKSRDGEALPQKRYFRQRAHCNPLSFNDAFDYPDHPRDVDWTVHYPAFKAEDASKALVGGITRHIEFLDIGCGFGGLTVELAKLFPSNLVMGMEIRSKVKEYVRLRIRALRAESKHTQYENASVMRTNCMKYLPNYFVQGQLKKIFVCFPDPHFKAKNHRRRIVTQQLLNEYAHFLAPGGILYTITDVKDLHDWMAQHGTAHACFARIPEEELADDPCIHAITECTEEGKKVSRNGGSKYLAIFRRVDPAAANDAAGAGPFFDLPSPAEPRIIVKAKKQPKKKRKQKETPQDTATATVKKPRQESS